MSVIIISLLLLGLIFTLKVLFSVQSYIFHLINASDGMTNVIIKMINSFGSFALPWEWVFSAKLTENESQLRDNG